MSAGTVYLICFSEPYKHARHYMGWGQVLESRLAQHRAGSGARFMQVIAEAGISWEVTRTWQGGRTLERKLKKRKKARKLCPACTPNAGIGRGNWKRAS